MRRKIYIIVAAIILLFSTGIFLMFIRYRQIFVLKYKNLTDSGNMINVTVKPYNAKKSLGEATAQLIFITDNCIPTIKWRLSPKVKNVQSYVIGIMLMTGSIDELSDHLWQVIYIPSSVTSLTYGRKPEKGVESSAPAKKLEKGDYLLYIFAYDTTTQVFDGRHIIGAGLAQVMVR